MITTREEYQKKLMKDSTFTKFGKALIFLKIGQVKIIDKGEKSLDRFNYKHRFLNPLNPISYIIIVLIIPVLVVMVLVKEVFPEIKKSFKYN